jgi:hypothetical protein
MQMNGRGRGKCIVSVIRRSDHGSTRRVLPAEKARFLSENTRFERILFVDTAKMRI